MMHTSAIFRRILIVACPPVAVEIACGFWSLAFFINGVDLPEPFNCSTYLVWIPTFLT
jgi:hypothetical protein